MQKSPAQRDKHKILEFIRTAGSDLKGEIRDTAGEASEYGLRKQHFDSTDLLTSICYT